MVSILAVKAAVGEQPQSETQQQGLRPAAAAGAFHPADPAALAVNRDPRFPPVSTVELLGLEDEISVLSPLLRVRDTRRIPVGRHGLLMRSGEQEGLLLPQVPIEPR
jgi:AMMECR1 domain-containing protein